MFVDIMDTFKSNLGVIGPEVSISESSVYPTVTISSIVLFNNQNLGTPLNWFYIFGCELHWISLAHHFILPCNYCKPSSSLVDPLVCILRGLIYTLATFGSLILSWWSKFWVLYAVNLGKLIDLQKYVLGIMSSFLSIYMDQ